ncbi:MAG: Sua5/YciO/YrdC/YwlC family protein [Planctomycetes bacterium]|nr:Sua5/YciO/YrdC/YwlC family protein [Planctomycetota bacterium]
MPTVLDWSPTVDPSELLRVTREAIAAGAVVVLPGDCGYVALVNPTSSHAVERLAALKAGGGAPPAILAWGADDPAGLGLRVSTIGRRLTFRAWPGPIVVAVAGEPDWPSEWPTTVRAALTANGPVRFRCPEHPLCETIIPALDIPVLIVDTFLSTVEAVLDTLNDPDALAVSVGELPPEGKPTLVTLRGASYEVTEPGLFPAEELEKFAAKLVLFVCTGNTCRSPLAEALAKKLLADRLGCSPDELPTRGLWMLSAGVAAQAGDPAAEDSITVAEEFGASLGNHEGRVVNPELLAAADEVITMTRAHAQALVARYPGVGPTPRLLCGNTDLDDPIGAGLVVYRACARTIVTHLERLLPEWIGQ